MFKKEFFSHLLFTLVWLTAVTLIRWSWHFDLLWLWVGGLAGTFLFNLDHLLYLLFISPHELTSQRVQRLLVQRKFKETLILMAQTSHERDHLPFHSAFFQIILLVLCFFVLTSTNHLFGSGLVMGMMLHLLRDEVGEWLAGQEERLKKWLFWQVRLEVSFEQQRLFIISMILFFVVLNLFLV